LDDFAMMGQAIEEHANHLDVAEHGARPRKLSFFTLAHAPVRVKKSRAPTCSQRNFSQNVFGDQILDFEKTLYDALVVEITGAGQFDMADITVSVKGSCPPFIGNKPTYMIPGSTELFLFPSLLYSQLAQFAQISGRTHTRDASARVLSSLRHIIDQASQTAKPEKILIDTSPFFGGATHLAWVAADALVVPVRVDQHSIEALRLTLSMLKDPDMDFQKFNTQAGLDRHPKVHAIVMTHCGWNRQKPNTPDSSTRFFVERALNVAKEFADVFSELCRFRTLPHSVRKAKVRPKADPQIATAGLTLPAGRLGAGRQGRRGGCQLASLAANRSPDRKSSRSSGFR
jgi:hypothetical protein